MKQTTNQEDRYIGFFDVAFHYASVMGLVNPISFAQWYADLDGTASLVSLAQQYNLDNQ